ncbi:MAG TPA: hypothetical protein VGU72_03735 [Beijerinckiaceae bacterium]|jgi:hypothetical protein|nr:hypothetical protein [Beijerinckiaceae bacterium]
MSDDKRDASASPASERASRSSRREPATIDARAEDMTPPAQEPVQEAAQEPIQKPISEPATETPTDTTATSADSAPHMPSPPPASTSYVPAAVAGLVGAVVTLIGAAGWQQFTATPPSANPAVAALEKRVATVETRLAAAPSTDALATLDKRIAAAEAQIKTATATPAAPAPLNLTPLEQRLAALEKPQPAAPMPTDGLSTDVVKRLAALEAAAAAPKASERATESRIEPTPAPPAAPPIDIKPLEARIAAVEQRLQPLQSSITGSSEAAKAAAVKVDEEAARSRATAQAIAAQSLQQSLERGAPLKSEIDTLSRLGVAPDRLAALNAFAASGAPSAKGLASAFIALEDKLIALEKPAADAGLMDRLSQAAQRLVRVRRAGDNTGSTPTDLVARIEAALTAGNISGAMTAWDLLPAAAKAASADWATQAKARLAADAAARALVADALAALGRKS